VGKGMESVRHRVTSCPDLARRAWNLLGSWARVKPKDDTITKSETPECSAVRRRNDRGGSGSNRIWGTRKRL